MKNYLKLLRIKSYVKNALIFIPFIFSGLIYKKEIRVLELILPFLAFSLVTSFVYIINDIFDRKEDAKHPTKKNRPIASGKIKILPATIIAIVLLLIGITISYMLKPLSAVVLLAYAFLNILYSIFLKQIPIIDLLCLSIFFIIRIIFGGVVYNVEISGWLYLTTLAAAFYFGIGKRKNEILSTENTEETREVLKYYSENYLFSILNIFLCMTIVYYSLWIINGEFAVYMNIICLYVSIVELIVIMLKYHLNLYSNKYGETPVEIFYKDKKILVGGIIYALTLIISMLIV